MSLIFCNPKMLRADSAKLGIRNTVHVQATTVVYSLQTTVFIPDYTASLPITHYSSRSQYREPQNSGQQRDTLWCTTRACFDNSSWFNTFRPALNIDIRFAPVRMHHSTTDCLFYMRFSDAHFIYFSPSVAIHIQYSFLTARRIWKCELFTLSVSPLHLDLYFECCERNETPGETTGFTVTFLSRVQCHGFSFIDRTRFFFF